MSMHFYIYGALGKNSFCQILKRWYSCWITGQNVQKLQIFAIFASSLWGNLKFYPLKILLAPLSAYQRLRLINKNKIFKHLHSSHFVINENARVSNLPRVDGVQNSPNNLDLNPVTLTYDLWPWKGQYRGTIIRVLKMAKTWENVYLKRTISSLNQMLNPLKSYRGSYLTRHFPQILSPKPLLSSGDIMGRWATVSCPTGPIFCQVTGKVRASRE